jgi:hypothetical protein
MGEAKWKRCEREVAKLLGGQRQPNTGRRGPDVVSPRWVVEVKLRSRLPQWLLRGLAQAEVGAKERGLAPLLVVVCPQGRGRPPLRLAILRLDTLVTLTRQEVMDNEGEGACR